MSSVLAMISRMSPVDSSNMAKKRMSNSVTLELTRKIIVVSGCGGGCDCGLSHGKFTCQALPDIAGGLLKMRRKNMSTWIRSQKLLRSSSEMSGLWMPRIMPPCLSRLCMPRPLAYSPAVLNICHAIS